MKSEKLKKAMEDFKKEKVKYPEIEWTNLEQKMLYDVISPLKDFVNHLVRHNSYEKLQIIGPIKNELEDLIMASAAKEFESFLNMLDIEDIDIDFDKDTMGIGVNKDQIDKLEAKLKEVFGDKVSYEKIAVDKQSPKAKKKDDNVYTLNMNGKSSTDKPN